MLEDYQQEIIHLYDYALQYIGVDFEREDVQLALENCHDGLEEALQRCVEYWLYLKERNKDLKYPSACLITALNEKWKPISWKSQWLEREEFKSPELRWWEAALKRWGKDWCVQLIADVTDGYIIFQNERTISLNQAHHWGWQRTLAYAIEQLPENHLLKPEFFKFQPKLRGKES
jgi:hypothetical protein